MFVPTHPTPQHSGVYGALPMIWAGQDAPTATNYFAKAPIGSIYIYKVSSTEVRTLVKAVHTPAAADWVKLGGTNQSKGFIPVPLTILRETGTSAIPNLAAHGGILASDSTPILNSINADTDGALRLTYAATVVDGVTFQVVLPDDFDDTGDVLVKFRAAMAGATDTPTLTLDSYFDEGDTKVEDATAAVTGATYATYTATIATADVPAARTLTVEMIPGAHGTDALYITAIWVEYTRK